MLRNYILKNITSDIENIAIEKKIFAEMKLVKVYQYLSESIIYKMK